MTTSKNRKIKLQKIQNQALRYAFNERHPYQRNTQQFHELATIDPVNLNLHIRAEKIFTILRNTPNKQFNKLMVNYAGEKKQPIISKD